MQSFRAKGVRCLANKTPADSADGATVTSKRRQIVLENERRLR